MQKLYIRKIYAKAHVHKLDFQKKENVEEYQFISFENKLQK